MKGGLAALPKALGGAKLGPAAPQPGRPVNSETPPRSMVSVMEKFGFMRGTWPHMSLAILALASSLRDRKIRVRRVWSRVRQASPPWTTERSEEIDWVATMGMQRLCRVRGEGLLIPRPGRPARPWRKPGTRRR